MEVKAHRTKIDSDSQIYANELRIRFSVVFLLIKSHKNKFII